MSTQTTPVLPRTGTVVGGASTMRRARRALQQVDPDKNLVLLILGILTFAPLVVMVFMSGKDQSQWFHERFGLSLPWHWENYTLAWAQIVPYMKNTFIVTIASTAGVLALSCIGGFVFARYNFPGKVILWYAILALLMVPGILTLIPSFILVKQLHLLNTLWALILPYVSGGQVFGMFLLRSFFASLPEEMFESARMDGAGDMTMLWRLAVPLSSSILGTLAILQVLSSWNDLIWPSVTLQAEGVKTLVLGLWQFQGQYYTNWGPLMAGYVLASIPLIVMFAFTSRLFVKGLSSGAIKM
jgi:multiple sugar transport system permease protein/raffinose/stachyose/melibiose transport system permease protein